MNIEEIWKKLGKQTISIMRRTDAKVFIQGSSKEYRITGIRYENGRPTGFNAK